MTNKQLCIVSFNARCAALNFQIRSDFPETFSHTEIVESEQEYADAMLRHLEESRNAVRPELE